MAITSTTNLSLNMYSDGDNPGAGVTNSSAPTNTGLNGNWHKIDAVAGGVITSAGALKSNVVTTASIQDNAITSAKIGANAIINGKVNLSATDDTTLTVASGLIKVKDSGIGVTQLASNAVTSVKIIDNAVTTAKIIDDAVTSAKIGSNNTKTKANFVFTKNTATIGYLTAGNVTTSATVGIPMMRAGSITGIYVTSGSGIGTNTANVGTHTFAIGDKLQVYVSGIQGEHLPPYTVSTKINDIDKLTVSNNNIGATTTMIVNIEVEYD